ncbi:MAG: hypothetical protein ACRDL5_04920 [Solirubrobacteraceae bacterium]
MQDRVRAVALRTRVAAPVVVLAVLALAACSSSSGGGSGQAAQSVLQKTFSKGHSIRSGVLSFSLSATPSGSSLLKGPLSLTLGGPFQSRGTGQVPASDFTITLAGLGQNGLLGVVSTGTAGYLTLDGTAYQLPAADFQKLESNFSSVGTSGGGKGFSTLGIDPMTWLTKPTVVGSDTVDGASTTHIRAGVDVAALLTGVDKLLGKAASSTGSAQIPTSIPPATQKKIAAAVRNATVDIWTGSSDHTLRRLTVHLEVPVSGQIASMLGGMSSVAIALTIQYADLNAPQTISAPAKVAPYSQFTSKLRSILASAFGGLGGLGALGGGSSSSSGGSSSATNLAKYSQCIQKAGGNVSKMQKCASLLHSGS